MNITNLREAGTEDFHILETTGRTQTATLRLSVGDASSDELEVHPHSDQVLLLLEGELTAEAGEEKTVLRKDDCIIIPAGVKHRFVNTGDAEAFAFNVYGPPAYQTDDPT